MLSTEPITTFRIIPRKTLSSLKDRKEFLNIQRIKDKRGYFNAALTDLHGFTKG